MKNVTVFDVNEIIFNNDEPDTAITFYRAPYKCVVTYSVESSNIQPENLKDVENIKKLLLKMGVPFSPTATFAQLMTALNSTYATSNYISGEEFKPPSWTDKKHYTVGTVLLYKNLIYIVILEHDSDKAKTPDITTNWYKLK